MDAVVHYLNYVEIQILLMNETAELKNAVGVVTKRASDNCQTHSSPAEDRFIQDWLPDFLSKIGSSTKEALIEDLNFIREEYIREFY